MRTIILLLAMLVLTTVPASASVTSGIVENGELLEAFALPGGGSLAVILQERMGGFGLAVAHNTGVDGFYTEYAPLPIDRPPDRVLIGVCGTQVHLFANWTTGYERAWAPVYEYILGLQMDSGICEQRAYQVLIPFIEGGTDGEVWP